jgi:hypothetical protein
MKNRLNSNFKACGTCDFWAGARTLTSGKTAIEYDTGAKGDCNVGRFAVTGKLPMGSCPKWAKWGQLKSL